MKKDSYDFLNKLLLTPSPSGFETKIQKIVKKRISKFSDQVSVDVHGNLIACFNPAGKLKVMLAGHCDQIGLMVTHISETGYISVNQIGGIDPSVLPGTNLVVHTDSGPIEGVIGYPPVHLVPADQRGKKIDLSKVWVDLGLEANKVKKLVNVGDPITYKLGVTKLGKDKIASPGCDDKVGLYVVMEALKIVSSKIKGTKKKSLPVALYSVSTVQEEIGLRGARTSCYGIDPDVGIAVDVTHATDNPGADPKKVGTVKLGSGPTIARGANVNHVLRDLLVSTAKKKNIKYQHLSAPRATGTDANAMQITKSGVATALIGIPNRYMHTQVEVVDLKDLDAAANLLAETIMSIKPRKSFIPV